MNLRFKKCALGVFLCIGAFLLIQTDSFAFDKRFAVSLGHFIMASYYGQLGELDECIKEYKKSLSVDYKNHFSHLNIAISYLKKNDIPKAINELNLAIKMDREAVEPHAILALLYYTLGKNDSATAEYESALQNASKLEPGNVYLYKNLAMVYLRQKKLKQAENIYKLILDLSPNDSEAHFYLASIYDEAKNREAAIHGLKKAIEFNPDYSEALNYLGYIYVEEEKNLDEAEVMIKKALLAEPDNGAYIDSLGWLYYKQGKVNEALNELKKAAGLLEDPVILDHLGDVYQKIGEYDFARQSWEKSLALNPGQEKINQKLKLLGTYTNQAVKQGIEESIAK